MNSNIKTSKLKTSKTKTSKTKKNKLKTNKSKTNKSNKIIKQDIDNKKLGIIVLDLDETLFHTKGVNVFYRPYVKKFLSFISKHFYLVVYTAALKTYADKILYDLLGKENIKKMFILKLYRNSVTNNVKI